MLNILPIADKEYVYLYSINSKNINEMYERFNRKYKETKNTIIKCDFIGGSPYCGKYLETHNNSKILNSQIIYLSHCESKKNHSLNFLNNGIKFYDRMSEEDVKMLQTICGGKQVGEVKLKVEEGSTIASIIKNTFAQREYEKNCHIVDFTDLVKLYNSINKIKNDFKDDKTLDNLNKDEKRKEITSLDDYIDDRKMRNWQINNPLDLNIKEKVFNNDDYKKLIIELVVNSSFNYYGKYPIDKRQGEVLEILKRFAIRNNKIYNIESFSSLLLNLKISMHKQHPISNIYDKINSLLNDYDLGGMKEREKVKNLIKNNPKNN